MKNTPLPLALLIDAENVSCKNIDQIMQETDKLGNPIVRCVYGDFTKPNMQCWNNIEEIFGIVKKQKFAYKPGKNCSDIELIMDAMELIFDASVEGLILVSGDSDFSGLLERFIRRNKPAYVMGNNHTAKILRDTATRFIKIKKQTPKRNRIHIDDKTKQATELFNVEPTKLGGLKIIEQASIYKDPLVDWVNKVLKMCNNIDGYVTESDFLSTIKTTYPNFDIVQKGYSSWPAFFIRQTHWIESKKANNTIYYKPL
jgi:hypothetical protein